MMRPNRKVISWVIAGCGLWEAGDISALFVPGFGAIPAYLWNHIGVGIILAIAGVWAARSRQSGTARTLHWVAAAAGAWLLIATFLLGNPKNPLGVWNDLLVAVIVLILSLWAALTTPKAAG